MYLPNHDGDNESHLHLPHFQDFGETGHVVIPIPCLITALESPPVFHSLRSLRALSFGPLTPVDFTRPNERVPENEEEIITVIDVEHLSITFWDKGDSPLSSATPGGRLKNCPAIRINFK